ncbi:DsrE family protein [Sulfurihydrogenibium sp.]|uniref:DsrE family protein n=1 Tax=Sulfurihydrogenibium sp. TaxID=2053621 RepID=UPI00260FB3B7|nr:DsrE family protein [Sulfurihydrogenibium sp.]
MKLLILMASNPYSADFNTMVKFSEAAIKRKDEISIFLMANGVYCLNHDKMKELAEKGVKIYYCAHNAHQRKINPVDFAESSSMYGLSKLISQVDKVINLS